MCIVELSSDSFFGFHMDPDKHNAMDMHNEYLGVISDLSCVGTHRIVRMDVSQKRRLKIRALIDEVDRAQQLRSGLAASLFGKCRFMISPCFGVLGKACLQPIMAREYQKGVTHLTSDLSDSLEFVHFLTHHLQPVSIPILPASSGGKVVVFVDASGSKRKGNRPPSGHLGFVIIHPTHGTVHAHAPVPASLIALLDNIKARDTYISQFEMVAAITPFASLPADWFKDRPVELWVDNSPAIGCLLKGYSGKPDCAKIANMFHFVFARLGAASLWIDYVPSESNIADIPSRAPDGMLHEELSSNPELALLLGLEVPMRIPQFADDNGDWISYLAIARSLGVLA